MLSRLLAGQTAGGEPFRRNLTQAVRDQIESSIRDAIGLTGWQERRYLQGIVSTVNQSQRIAFRVQRGGDYPARSRNIPVDPYTTGEPGSGYTYTVVVVDPLGGGSRASSTPVTFHSDRLLTRDEIRARALVHLSQGDVLEQYRSRIPGLQLQQDLETILLTVYRGGGNVGTGT